MATAYAGIAAWWAVCWIVLHGAAPGHPLWAEAVVAFLAALATSLPAALAACLLWNAVLGLIDGFSEGAPSLRPPRRPVRSRSIRCSPPA